MRKNILTILKSIVPDADFERSQDFFEDNLINSFGIMTLITVLEENFKISINGEDISADNLMNLECIEKLMEKYLRS